jgi:hypothetical protein
VPASIIDRINASLRDAARAPSAHNTQPWSVSWEPNTLHVSRSMDHTLQVGDPTTRQATIGVGMFTETFTVAAKRWGLTPVVEVTATWPTSPGLVDIHVTACDPIDTPPLYAAIAARSTNRGLYDPDLDPYTLARLLGVESSEGVTIHPVLDPADKSAVGRMVRDGMQLALSMPALRLELAELTYWDDEPRDRGMAIESLLGSSRSDLHPSEPADAWFQEHVEAVAEAERLERAYSSAPVLLVISSDGDDPTSWVHVGRTACRLLLTAAEAGLSHCISAAPIEVPTLAPRLRAVIPDSSKPQMLMRVGKAHEPSFGRRSHRAASQVMPTSSTL